MNIIRITVLLAAAAALAVSGQELKWAGFNKGRALVVKKKKPAVIDFYTDWCRWCKVMDTEVYNSKKIKRLLLKNYITIKINPEKSKEKIQYDGKTFSAMELAQALGVRGFPATVFMDRKGEFVTMLPGYIPPETFLQV
jgi:thioredoxin-related protein